MNIRGIINNLIDRYGTKDPFILCNNLNITIMYAELGSINGYYIQVPKHQLIFINKDLDKKRQAFVCAHELGHAVMHKGLNTFFMQNNTLNIKGKFERQANEFASELLIDDHLLLEYEGKSLDYISKCENINIAFLKLKFNK